MVYFQLDFPKRFVQLVGVRKEIWSRFGENVGYFVAKGHESTEQTFWKRQ